MTPLADRRVGEQELVRRAQLETEVCVFVYACLRKKLGHEPMDRMAGA